ncbi:MAG: hypothetical protein K0R76_880 [Alphaproteobacteria bacterium]|jgi:hypothetical protein|nr:hypothetical protein [Alphaproteobacteria bacterium]MDF3033926.1 hypothetical protein [Alphaproteobacteria bacterium]
MSALSLLAQSALEDMCKKYAEPIGESEISRCERAERMIKNAIEKSRVFDSDKLAQISIFAQGSYKNGTNVSQDSDVDIAICYTGSFFYEHTQISLISEPAFNLLPATYRYESFKADVIRSLQAEFGQEMQTGNKSLKILKNSGRVSADAVPCFVFQQFLSSNSVNIGTRFISGDGKIITNWPDHHYRFGIEKNKATSFRFKKVVRILKSLRENIRNSGYAVVAETPSFLIECLVWNATDACFNTPTLLDGCKAVLHNVASRVQNNQEIEKMCEVNRMKYLFSPKQPWSVQDAKNYIYYAGKELQLW